MDKHVSQIDYRGARGSNTGDEYHELWAVRQALRMLDATSDLTAVTVEGVPAIEGSNNSWDGVDCTLLFGGLNLGDADRVEVQQLRYSAATPDKKWTVARICRGKNGKPQTSLIRRFGDAFKALANKRRGAPLKSIKISLISNQPVAPELTTVFADARTFDTPHFSESLKSGDCDLHRVFRASGLSCAQFKHFAGIVDFQGETGSRFAIENEMLNVIAEWTDTEFKETAHSLRDYVRKLMLPEAAGELITKHKILIQFGVSDERALFPCRSEITCVDNPVLRSAIKDTVDTISAGGQRICLHGNAGVGKTTALQQIATFLPSGTEMITFDCYGGGAYLDASQLRHRPRDAFVQLSNDLAQRLTLPSMFVPKPGQDFARAFRKRLDIGSTALRKSNREGRLVISIDAADNSITAAKSQTPPESSFVTELMSFVELPPNVSLLVTARTGRLDELNPPSDFKLIELLPFSQQETAQNAVRHWAATLAWIEDFHHLSGGVPRVQAYAFEQAGEVQSNALTALRPLGKRLDQIFDERVHMALKKSGRIDLIEKVCAGLTVLPRPIPVSELSYVLGLSESQVIDICGDLAPGVRSQSGAISLSDEDFEAYLRERAGSMAHDIQRIAADRFLDNAGSDEYAAMNVANLLLVAERGEDLLDFVEREPEPNAAVIPDPIQRREIHNKRLLTAIRACRKAGNMARALRFVLIGAEAVRTNQATQALLALFPRLSVKYAKETSSRLILRDPDRIADHGRLLFYCLGEDAANGDAYGVRETRRRLHAWFEARRDYYRGQVQEHGHGDAWPVGQEDFGTSLYASALMDGADAAIAHFRWLQPFKFAIGATRALLTRLLVEHRFELAEEIAMKIPPWQAVFVLVPLARAGRQFDVDRLASGLAALKRRFSLDARTLGQEFQDGSIGPYVIDTVLSAAEILVGHGAYPEIANIIISPFLDYDLRRMDKRHDFEVPLLDAILRSCCLTEAMRGKSVAASDVLTVPTMSDSDSPMGGRRQREFHPDSQLKKLVDAITPVYVARAQIIVGAQTNKGKNVDLKTLKMAFGHDAWRFDRSYSSSVVRARLAEGLTNLVAVGASAQEVMVYALGCHREFKPNGKSGAGELIKRLTAIPYLHSDLLGTISEAVSAACDARTGSKEKSETLAALSELLLPISSDEAISVFQKAVQVASELDIEAMDQLRLLDGLIERGRNGFSTKARLYAALVAEIVNDAAIRLQDNDEFPWPESISSIAHLDVPTALASVARWDDYQVGTLGATLPPAIIVGLRTNYLNSAQAAALLPLLRRAPVELLTSVMEHAIGEGHAMASALAEELAYDALVDRIPLYGKLEPPIVQYGQGYWASQFGKYDRFRKALRDDSSIENEDTRDQSKLGPAIIDSQAWHRADLTDPSKLLHEAQNVLTRLRDEGSYVALGDVLRWATKAVPLTSRLAHLDALVRIHDDEHNSQIVDIILSAMNDWANQLAVKNWCNDRLPRLLATHLPSFAQCLPWDDSRLITALALAETTSSDVQAALLEGLERHADSLSVSAIFSLAGVIASSLTVKDSAELSKWYINRLVQHIPTEYQEEIDERSIPVEAAEVVGRFLYAFMSDVDLRKRWCAAHGFRRLARLGENNTLAQTVAQYRRDEDCGFRAANAPFYWLSARLWLMIGLDRVSEETPEAAMPHGNTLIEISLCDAFPHMLIRDYAADACRKLISSGHWQPNVEQMTELAQVNKGLPSTKTRNQMRNGSFDSFHSNKSLRRFGFNSMDTLPYWYNRWLSVFEDLTPDAFLEAAEKWIVDTWAVCDTPPFSLKELRPQRFRQGSFGLSHHSHGSIPTLERYRSHLEWHAMWCAAGQLLNTHCVRVTEDDDYYSLQFNISTDKLTHPPQWLSDFVGPVPIQKHRWKATDEPIEDWLSAIDDTDFLREIFPADRPGRILVNADIDVRSYKRDETVRVMSGLVSPKTAHALVRALQTAENNFNFYICPEGHHEEIKGTHYVMQGWLTHIDGDLRFDEKDPYRNGLGHLRGLPGEAVTKALGLKRRCCLGRVDWLRGVSNTPSFTYEAWGEREPDDFPRRYLEEMIGCSGSRTLVNKEDLAEFLYTTGCDLIVDIAITRREQRNSGRPYDSKEPRRTVFNRILLLRRSGAVEAAERSFKAWR